MYCSTCGIPLQSRSNFCSSCGSSVKTDDHRSPQRARGSSSPIFTLRPTFIPWLSVLSVLPIQAFMTLWGALFFGGFATFGLQAAGLDIPKYMPFVVAGAVFFLGIPLLVYFAQQKTYAKTKYRFFPQKLDYFEGFFTTEEKSIEYNSITEVNLRRGLFQKMYGLGTIILSTPATGAVSGRARSGIRLVDISNPERVYQQVKELLKRF